MVRVQFIKAKNVIVVNIWLIILPYSYSNMLTVYISSIMLLVRQKLSSTSQWTNSSSKQTKATQSPYFQWWSKDIAVQTTSMCFLLLQHLLTGTSQPHKTQNSFIIVTKAMRNQISQTSTKADAYLTERREEDPPLCSCFHEEFACPV